MDTSDTLDVNGDPDAPAPSISINNESSLPPTPKASGSHSFRLVPIEIYDENTSTGMATGGSDEWANFIAIDVRNSQESLDKVFGRDGNNGRFREIKSGVSFLASSPTDWTKFTPALNGNGAADGSSKMKPLEKGQVAKGVCQLLGLPRGHIDECRQVTRGNMLSSSTHQKLRTLLEEKEPEKVQSVPSCPDETIAFSADQFVPTVAPRSAAPNQWELPTRSPTKGGEEPNWHKNILTEGEYYLAMSMLVYIYALLREAALLGHTHISFDEIDINSSRSTADSSSCASHKKKLWSMTKSAGFIIRVVMDELEKSNGSIIGKVGQSEGDISIMKEFKRLVMDSHVPQVDAATEETMKQLRRKVARRRWRRVIMAVRLIVRIGKSSSTASLKHGSASVPNNHVDMPQTTEQGCQEGQTGSEQCFKSTDSTKSISSIDFSSVKNIAHHALDGPRFFQEGSLMGNLIESGIEVVWIDDRHPDELVYSICCNRQMKRVSVVFRGTTTLHNWLQNMKYTMTEYANPIAEEYPSRADNLGFHTGFALYLLRKRKDTGRTKIEELFTNIDSIGRELAADGDYELSMTGHSLGGALATILSFYAAASKVFSNVKTIRAFTYAAPRVGCQRFAHAFQHLEKSGRLRLARFSNTHDIVPLVPFSSYGGGLGRPYKHVGMHIRMNGVSKLAQHSLRKALDVTYPNNHGYWPQLWRGFRSSIMMNLNTIQGYMKQHSLSEYQRQIHFANKYRSALSLSDFLHCEKRKSLKTLDEYYFIKGASAESTPKLTKIFLYNQEKKNDRQKSRKIVIRLLLIILAEAFVLLSLLSNTSYSPITQHRIKQNEQHFNAATKTQNPNDGKLIKWFLSKVQLASFSFITTSKTHYLGHPKSNFSIPYLPRSPGQPRQPMPWGVRRPHNNFPLSLIKI